MAMAKANEAFMPSLVTLISKVQFYHLQLWFSRFGCVCTVHTRSDITMLIESFASFIFISCRTQFVANRRKYSLLKDNFANNGNQMNMQQINAVRMLVFVVVVFAAHWKAPSAFPDLHDCTWTANRRQMQKYDHNALLTIKTTNEHKLSVCIEIELIIKIKIANYVPEWIPWIANF